MERDPSYNQPDEARDESGPEGEISPDEDTSGGPLSSGAGPGSGQGAEDAPDENVPGGADEGV
jgi:hypothetical protein